MVSTLTRGLVLVWVIILFWKVLSVMSMTTSIISTVIVGIHIVVMIRRRVRMVIYVMTMIAETVGVVINVVTVVTNTVCVVASRVRMTWQVAGCKCGAIRATSITN